MLRCSSPSRWPDVEVARALQGPPDHKARPVHRAQPARKVLQDRQDLPVRKEVLGSKDPPVLKG